MAGVELRFGPSTVGHRFRSCMRSGPERAARWQSARGRCCACRASSTSPAASSSPLRDIAYGGSPVSAWALLAALGASRCDGGHCRERPICNLVARHGVQAQRVPLGVDLQRWPARSPVRRRGGEQARLVHVASLNRVKDQGTLLRALRMLARSRAVTFGSTSSARTLWAARSRRWQPSSASRSTSIFTAS